MQVAGQNLKYARTVNAKLILRKKLSLQRHAKPEISLAPGNCLFGVRFCSPEPYRSKFLSFTLLKITTNGEKKTGCEIVVVNDLPSTCPLSPASEFDM